MSHETSIYFQYIHVVSGLKKLKICCWVLQKKKNKQHKNSWNMKCQNELDVHVYFAVITPNLNNYLNSIQFAIAIENPKL